MIWSETRARVEFNELLDKAETEGAQVIRRGSCEFVLLTREEYEAILVKNKPGEHPFISAWDALAPSSGARYDVSFPRLRGKPRKVNFE